MKTITVRFDKENEEAFNIVAKRVARECRLLVATRPILEVAIQEHLNDCSEVDCSAKLAFEKKMSQIEEAETISRFFDQVCSLLKKTTNSEL